MTDKPAQAVPTLTADTPAADHVAGQRPILNGRNVNVAKTHPNLYRITLGYAIGFILLGLNFFFLNPTFLIFDLPNDMWGAIFLLIGTAKIVFLRVWRNLRMLRATMAVAVSYILFIAAGTTQPFLEGEGSLQLPILYAGWAILQLPLLLEPFVNPWTASHDE